MRLIFLRHHIISSLKKYYMKLVLPSEMVDKSTGPFQAHSGQFLVMRQSMEAYPSRSKAAFECFCSTYAKHPRSQHDMLVPDLDCQRSKSAVVALNRRPTGYMR